LLHANPSLVTNATNRHLLQPTKINKRRRKSQIQKIQEDVQKGKHRDSSPSSKSGKPLLKTLVRGESSSSSSTKSKNSELVDLVVEDTEAEEIERVRARKEGGPKWNETDPKHFVRAYPPNQPEEEVREGDEPGMVEPHQPHDPDINHDLDNPLHEDENLGGEAATGDARDGEGLWQHRRYEDGLEPDQHEHEPEPEDEAGASGQYGSFREERDVWSRADNGSA
jgi:hypothetical protein